MNMKRLALVALATAAVVPALALLLAGGNARGTANAVTGSDTAAASDGSPEIVPVQLTVPSPADLRGADANEALSLAFKWADQGKPVTSWLTSDALHVSFSSGERASVPLPEGRSLIAVAPYRSATHPCSVHYISGCTGELAGMTFDVTVKRHSGTVVLEDRVTTRSDGFLYLWLPRDISGTITVMGGAQGEGTSVFSTSDGGATCITDLQLS